MMSTLLMTSSHLRMELQQGLWKELLEASRNCTKECSASLETTLQASSLGMQSSQYFIQADLQRDMSARFNLINYEKSLRYFNQRNLRISQYSQQQYQQNQHHPMIKFQKGLDLPTHYNQQIHKHVHDLLERQQQIIKEKLEKQHQKQAKIKNIENSFVVWAERKQSNIKNKLEKSSKNKEEAITKIVKKCHEHDKYVGEKVKKFNSKKKKNLKDAWKKSEAYQSEAAQFSKTRSIRKKEQQLNPNDLSVSRILSNEDPQNEQITQSINKNQSSINNLRNTSQPYISSIRPNNSIIPNSSILPINQMTHPVKIHSHHNNAFLTNVQNDETPQKDSNFNNQNKLQTILKRFKQNLQNQQLTKIQHMGERLQKIEKYRKRKLSFLKKKRQHTDIEYEEKEEKIKKQKKFERIHSEQPAYEKRVKDWSDYNKQKRQEKHYRYFIAGTEYLEREKMKFLKNSLAKKVAMSTIQKKLFYQRFNNG